MLADGLSSTREFDDFPGDTRASAIKEWSRYKEKEVLSYLKETYYAQAYVQDYKKY